MKEDALSDADFAAAMAPLFEGAPKFLARLGAARPFGTPDNLFDAARGIAHTMPIDEQIELIDAHPRLGAPPGTVSAMSYVEQGYDRETTPPGDVAAELDRLNAAYEARFGFRYCVFVAGRSRADLLPGFEAAMNEDDEAERYRAIDAVVDIARDRHRSMTSEAGPMTVEPGR